MYVEETLKKVLHNNRMEVLTVLAPVNIAVIKYWGKRDENLILPLNDSVSATLDTQVMCAKTSVCASIHFESDRIWLNGKEESFSNPRLQNCLLEIKERAKLEGSVDCEFLSHKVHICSENNFPTAAGLASSAAGYACLVSALAKLYKLESEISSIARLGSGSACRSVYGGFVQWHAGRLPDGSDSIATQVADVDHWPDMRVLILVVSDSRKKTSSTKGMKDSAETSELLNHRVASCVQKKTDSIIRAIKEKDFAKFAEITMKDSNQFHAVCLDTYPPCVYMNNVSHSIVELIHEYNEVCGAVKVAYTFDAGPNACLYLLKDEVPKILSVIKEKFPPLQSETAEEFVTGYPVEETCITDPVSLKSEPHNSGLIKYIIHTKVGDGPTIVQNGPHLLDKNGMPIF